MKHSYDPATLEKRWQKFWEEQQLFQDTAIVPEGKKKEYLLFAFAYPSGSGLHVGHVESKAALDILARYYRMQGKHVFFPVGWDAFGLPAENYAIKTGVHPAQTTDDAITTFQKQIKRIGISYDWKNELRTSDPTYYRWTQWIFLELFKAGLAYKKSAPVNWCPSCNTVLANEQVVNGECERCGASVIQKEMNQWFFKITQYQDELISGLDQVDWPAPTKQQQLNWIGKSEGLSISFPLMTAPTNHSCSTNSLYDHPYQHTLQIARDFYLSYLQGKQVFSPLLDDVVLLTRSFWNHLLEKDRKQSQVLFRLYALPKVYNLLSVAEGTLQYSKGNDTKKHVEFWSWQAEIEGVRVGVTVRSVNNTHKHLYSITWLSETENFSNKQKTAPSPADQSLLRQDCKNSVLQRDNFVNHTTIMEYLSMLLSKTPIITLKAWTKFWETVYGVTFLVIAPETFEQLGLSEYLAQDLQQKVADYINTAKNKTEEERAVDEKNKTGVDTGLKAQNPVTGEFIPLFIADYVLEGVGTGVVMGVPAHDQRDFAFAKKYNLPIKQVVSYADKALNIQVKNGERAAEQEGILINSGQFDGQEAWGEGKQNMADWLVKEGRAEWNTTYKLRDWLISRQRYWGTPIPIVYDPDGKPHPVKEEHLPWTLPTDVDFKPTGESPLRSSRELQARVERLYGTGWVPEYDTMDTFVDSSWYYLRYTSIDDNTHAFDAKKVQSLLPVDLYMIGPEHIVLHLLYSRFFTKFLRDQGLLDFDEPFVKMRHQGMILGPDGKKMSKSKGNVINPDDVVDKFGADTLRMYEMFMGPIDADKPWSTTSVAGVYRFLSRYNSLVRQALDYNSSTSTKKTLPSSSLQKKLHQVGLKVSSDIPEMRFNTAIAALMELVNEWQTEGQELSLGDTVRAALLIAPFAPFLAEELYSLLPAGQRKCKSVHLEDWPEFSPELAKEDAVIIAAQVNGKVRSELLVDSSAIDNQTLIEEKALMDTKVTHWIDGKTVLKVIYVPGKIINFVLNTNEGA
ncbi:MAG: leucine--tRNA ligase [Pseudomonadales bacterium]|nr:leucine--tRNA ligase [Pseudomonadales bacterium]